MSYVLSYSNKFVYHKSLFRSYKVATIFLETYQIVAIPVDEHRSTASMIITARLGAFCHVCNVRKSKKLSRPPSPC